MRLRLKLFVVLPAVALLMSFAGAVLPGHAQTGPAAATAETGAGGGGPGGSENASGSKALSEAGLSPAEVDDLIATLESEDARSRLVRRLKGLRAAAEGEKSADGGEAKPRGTGGRAVSSLSSRVERISTELVAGATLLLDAPRLLDWFEGQLADPSSRDIWVRVLWKVLLVLAAGVVAEWIVRRLLARPRKAVEGRERDSLWLRLPFLIARTFLDVMPIAVFGVVAYVVLPVLEPGEATRLVAIALINASVIARMVMAAARMFFVPRATNLRILRLSDETANYLVIWTRRFVNVAIYGYFLAEAALLLGLPEGGHGALAKTIGLLIALLATIFILQNRKPVSAAIQGDQTGGSASMRVLRRRFADIWHVLAIVYVFALYAVWALEIEGGFEFVFRATALSLVILVAAKLLMIASRHGMNAGFGIRPELVQRFPGLSLRANRYFAVLHYVINGVVLAFALFAVLEAWGVDSFAWIGTPMGRRVAGSAVTIVIVAVLSILLWEMVSSIIERYLSRDDDSGFVLSARARTLLPLVRMTLLIVIATISGFIVLAELGVNIGPLLAGAGVIGLAIGFGAQTLVKDVITGLFILAEDQFSVGDVIVVGGQGGLVEAITIRTIRMRDLAGNVHMIPFSTVDKIENMTKGFSRYVFDVGVAYREDVDEVIGVLRALGEEMQADEYYGDLILEPLEIMGLDKFGDSAIVVRARFTTRPIKQWEVGREFNRRIKRRFDELGIEIPFPHQTVYFGEDKQGAAPPAFVRIEDRRTGGGSGSAPSGDPDAPRAPTDTVDNVAGDGE